jgi:hypothetical protein
MIKILAVIGLITVLVIISVIFGAILSILEFKDKETRKREKWSRTFDDPNHLNVEPPNVSRMEVEENV